MPIYAGDMKFLKQMSLEHHKKNKSEIGVGKPFNTV
jgi:hypothetical protein